MQGAAEHTCAELTQISRHGEESILLRRIAFKDIGRHISERERKKEGEGLSSKRIRRKVQVITNNFETIIFFSKTF